MTRTAPKIRAAVAGATGYAGAELVRLLLDHPAVELVAAYGSRGAMLQPLAAALPGLRGLTSLELNQLPETSEGFADLDVLFLALPHGVAMDVMATVPSGVRVIDLSGDFRLRDAAQFARYYGFNHRRHELTSQFLYGQPETVRDASRFRATQHVASPGCFATACIVALAPLIVADLVEPRLILDGKTGSTGSGAKPSPGTHHPERVNGFSAYKSFCHQHLPEIRQALSDCSPTFDSSQLVLQTHSTPLIRGIFITAYGRLRADVDSEQVARAFTSFGADQPFIRLGSGSPNVNWSRGSNFIDLGYATEGREIIVFAALDNLGKGAASQAVQAMNLMFGRQETEGLWRAGAVP